MLEEDLGQRPDVAAQQKVRLAVERGAIRIVVAGTALADGTIGERIRVGPAGIADGGTGADQRPGRGGDR